MTLTLSRRFQFDAAHRNTHVAEADIRARMHGHTYEALISATGPLDEKMGWLLDFGDLKATGNAVINQLDHYCLNEIEGLKVTTLTGLADWIRRQVAESLLSAGIGCDVRIVGATAYAPIVTRGDGDDSISRITFGFAAAHYLPRLPQSHRCHRLHGHSFEVTVATPDDYRTLSALEHLYPHLDHRCLNDVPELENPTSEIFARWLWSKLAAARCRPHEVIVRETCTTACHYTGD